VSVTHTISRYDGDVRWIPASEAARQLGVSRQRVYRLVYEGVLVACRYPSNVLVSQRSVEARLALTAKEDAEDVANW